MPALVFGCGDGSHGGVVTATATVFNRTTHALAAGALQFVNGTYTTCVGHADKDSWSVPIDTTAGAGTNPILTVAQGDTGCTLTLASLDTSPGQNYVAAVPFALTGAYQPTAVSFATTALGATAFYGNALMAPADFSSNFLISILYSDDPRNAAGASGTAVAAVSATAVSTQVPAPDYAVADLSSVTVTTNSMNNVIAVSGSANFIDGLHNGQDYVIVPGALPDAPPTFADDDTAFAAASPSTAAGDPPSVPGAMLLAIGTNLPAIRTVILRNTNAASGVTAYETIQLTFNP